MGLHMGLHGTHAYTRYNVNDINVRYNIGHRMKEHETVLTPW